ncbi:MULTISPECIES: multidrug effflux MFS transporter [unclassified Acinetobacter]|uniref:multidrug effflux MFS transporter n=1 Tax=unclassified Acinetobacter TaxID=196816 RepID=UPI0015D40786|nr:MULTISPECIES: multidrug effflux MFS transporter [unclassified Acinetobacter]UUS58376.1 multidrug effflux MFS transporter [Acinetobacter sp. YH16040_T]
MKSVESQKEFSQRWIVLLALLTALGPLSIDMYLPALPQMADDFGVTTQQVANSLPAYFLGLAIGQLIYGPVSDRIGRKTPLYFGLVLYICASFLCVFAKSEWSLIAARVLQALGGCVGVVIARAAIRDRLSMQASAQAFASMMIVTTIAPIIAPTLGAWVLQVFEWQYIFAVLVLVGIFCLFCVHFFFQETLPVERRLKLSLKQVLGLYGAILQDETFRKPMLTGCFSGAILFCYISGSSAILMDGYGLSQQQFAYVFGANALGIMVFSTLNKKLANRLEVRHRLQLGNALQLCGVLILLAAGLFNLSSIVVVMLGMFLCVASIGFTGPNAMALAMSEQGSRAGTASAIMGSMQFVCGLLAGVFLNFLVWSALINMALIMLLFVVVAMITMRSLKASTMG